MSPIKFLFKNLFNPFNMMILRSPLHGLFSKFTMILTYRGRKSGKLISVPISYFRDGNVVTNFSNGDRQWWRNLKGGVPVTVRIQGRDYTGTADLVSLSREELETLMLKSYKGMSREQIRRMIPEPIMVQIVLDQPA
jgi:hypothetical protein